MKKSVGFLCIIMLLFLTGCRGNTDLINFFGWMDGYAAAGQGEEFVIAFTFFFPGINPDFHPDDVSGISFKGIDEKIEITEFEVEEADIRTRGYSSYAVDLIVIPREVGTYQTDSVILTLDDNRQKDYPVGSWTFEVGEKEETEYINVEESISATDDPGLFLYDYKSSGNEVKVQEIQYGESLSVKGDPYLPMEGEIEMKSSGAPVRFVKAKLQITVDGEEKTAYGKEIYCGAIGDAKKGIEKTREFLKQ